MIRSGEAMRFLMFALATLVAVSARAEVLNGSDGSDGALNVTSSTTLPMPDDGIFNYTSINVSGGATLTFLRNSLNTPVYLLATGDVTITGTINVSASDRTGGPGGFDGGDRGFKELPAGPGHGPGGGRGESSSTSTSEGAGAYRAVQFAGGAGTRAGSPYGSPLLVPLVGGSGAGGKNGSPGTHGGGGGGAILIASDTRVTVTGTIRATGARPTSCGTEGSGGAIRLVAPVVAGTGTLDVRSGDGGCNYGGTGRVRLDTANVTNVAFSFTAGMGATSIGAYLVAFPPAVPRLDILQVADVAVASGSAVTITLPFGSSPTQTVDVRAQDFGTGAAKVYIRLEPNSGVQTVLGPFTIANNTTLPITATFPVNNPTRVLVWGEPTPPEL